MFVDPNKVVSADISAEHSIKLAASSSQNSLPRRSSISANSSTNSLSCAISIAASLLKTHCQATANLFIYVKKTFLVNA